MSWSCPKCKFVLADVIDYCVKCEAMEKEARQEYNFKLFGGEKNKEVEDDLY